MEEPLPFERIRSLRESRRVARARGPVARGIPPHEAAALGEAAQRKFERRRGAQPSWVGDYIESLRGLLLVRQGNECEPDAPCLVAASLWEFAVYHLSWPLKGAAGFMPLAIALGHLHLHVPTTSLADCDDDPDGHDEPPPLYVPHFIAPTSPYHAARLEAIGWATGFLMPEARFRTAWMDCGGNAAATAEDLAIPGVADLVFTRAASLGLARN